MAGPSPGETGVLFCELLLNKRIVEGARKSGLCRQKNGVQGPVSTRIIQRSSQTSFLQKMLQELNG